MKNRFRLSTTVFAFLLIAVLILYAGFIIVMRLTIAPVFEDIEKQLAIQDINRAKNGLLRELNRIDGILRGYSDWDETYDFARGAHSNKGGLREKYLSTNFGVGYFENVEIDFICIIGDDGTTLYESSASDAPELCQALSALVTTGNREPIVDYAWSRRSLLLVASRVISDNTGIAIPHGRICFGRFFDAKAIESLSSALSVDISLSQIPRARDVTPVTAIEPDEIRFAVEDKQMSAFSSLRDRRGEAVATLTANNDRRVVMLGNDVFASFGWIQGTMIVVLGLIVFLFLKFKALAPLKKLTLQTSEIARSGDFSQRLDAEGRNEISVLAFAFNSLLDKLSRQNIELEIRIAERTDKLRVAIEDLRLMERVFENSLEGILITDSKGMIVRVNPAFSRITGFSPDEVIGKNPSILKSGRHDKEFYQEMWRAIIEDGQWAGELWNRSKDGRAYPEWLSIAAVSSGSNRAEHFVAVFHDISDIKRQQELISHLAFHDALTGLPNRLFMVDHLDKAISRCLRRGSKLAVLFMDLDRFKAINDTRGHHVGDLVLQEAAKRLRGACRSEETLSRQGGDEFVIVMEEIDEVEAVARFGRRLIDRIGKAFKINKEELQLGMSIGASIFPDDGETSEELLRNADQAMYESKKAGRNAFNLFKPEANIAVIERLNWEREIQKLIESGNIDIGFEEIFNISSGNRIGYEAFAISQTIDPGRGEFAKAISAIDKAIDIDFLILNKAFSALREKLAGESQTRLSINLSKASLNTGDLDERLAMVLDLYGLKPSSLVVEIDEKILQVENQKLRAILNRLSSMGISISLDNFGSGFSSFGLLTRLPFHCLKISPSFVRNIAFSKSDAEIVTSIVAMARRLSLRSVALGVENLEQLDFLREIGCDMAQGSDIAMIDIEKRAFAENP